MRVAAGFILFSDQEGERRFLLLRNARHGTWAFPKGHLEAGEEPLMAARRETQEETGLAALEELPGFEGLLDYVVPEGARPGTGSYRKRLHLYLARTPTREWVRSDEHDTGAWLTAEAVLARLQHADLKDVMLRAMAHLAAWDPAPGPEPG